MLSRFLKMLRNPLGTPKCSQDLQSIDEWAEKRHDADTLFAAQCYAEALLIYEAIYARDTRAPGLLLRLGLAYGASGRLDEAESFLARAKREEPHSIDLLNAQANLAWLRAQWLLAEQRFREALAMAPDNPTVWANLGLCLHDAGRLEDAASALERAIALDPAHADARLNAALVCMDRGDVTAAGAHLQYVLNVSPDFPEAHTLRAQWLLMQADYAGGWNEYEWRLRCGDSCYREDIVLPCWNGAAQDRLMIYAEQGLGDQIMFGSCLSDVLERVPHVEIECDPRLTGLFARSFPAVSVRAQTPGFERPWAAAQTGRASQIHCGSLPQLFRRTRAEFPAHSGYLSADAVKTAQWSRQLASLGAGLKVGIAWRGGVPRTRQAMRSIPLIQWLPVLQTQGVCFISLQHGPCDDELAQINALENVSVTHWSQAIDDYEETAALIGALDLVITVCSSVVHLAGALGKPVWVLVPTCPEWRYLQSGETMPWYPSAHLFRQVSSGDWRAPLTAIEQMLGLYRPLTTI